MRFGENMQYLRKMQEMTQEELAQRLDVSRQTVSKWEMGAALPEIGKLLEICDLFRCKVDEVLREDMPRKSAVYSGVELRKVEAFRMARYVMITPNPENDVKDYMDRWAHRNGLSGHPGARRIGWDFPFVSQEQQSRFGLRGYAAAWMLPEGFEPECCDGVEMASQSSATYACITVTDPFIRPFESIPGAYGRIMEYLNANGFRENPTEDCLPCFEHEYERDGRSYMDVYVHVESVGQTHLFTPFR